MPAFLALVPGFFAGSLLYGVIIHWVTLLLVCWRRNPIGAPLPATGITLARIFTVLHPVPWLLVLGLPFGLHRLFTDPPAAGWCWFFAGAVGYIALISLYTTLLLRRKLSSR